MSRTARFLLGALLAALPLVTVALAGVWGWRELHQPYRGWQGEEALLDFPIGTSAREIVTRLEAEGVIESAGLARLYLLYAARDSHLLAGEYSFSEPATTVEVLDRIARGDVATHPLTVIEGLTLDEIAAAIAAAGFGDEDRLRSAMGDPSPVRDLDPAAPDLEGYLFPDTYSFARGATEEAIVATMVSTFRRAITDALGPAPPAGEVRRVVTLASIVEKETGLDEERPLVAGVFANRLRIGMALGADPTIIYALKKAGTWDGDVKRADLQMDSPYNTYRVAGLPPGPICSPGLASLKAAASPATTPNLYFVSRNDGSHVFAATLQEHNRNVERWQKAFWRERPSSEGGAAAAAAP